MITDFLCFHTFVYDDYIFFNVSTTERYYNGSSRQYCQHIIFRYSFIARACALALLHDGGNRSILIVSTFSTMNTLQGLRKIENIT